MAMRPETFLRQPLEDLVAALAQTKGPVFDSGDIALHCAASTRLTIDGDARLPLNMSDVSIRGVVLEQYLGSGGQGAVFAGRITATGKVVAVKVFNGRTPRALREALYAARIRHPHVVRILQTQPAGTHWVVVSELVQGEELSAQHRPADPRECFRHLAEAITAIGRAGLVHRDVKPANVVLRQPDASPVLIDFGLAAEIGAAAEDDADISGTPMFLPPEAWEGERPNPAWDAYALGVTAAVVLAPGKWYVEDVATLRSAKLSGLFATEMHGAMRLIADSRIRDWVIELTEQKPEQRSTALKVATDYLAA